MTQHSTETVPGTQKLNVQKEQNNQGFRTYPERKKREEQFCYSIIPLVTHFLDTLHRSDFTIPKEYSGIFKKSVKRNMRNSFHVRNKLKLHQ